jgi:hypothetical protein
VRGFIPTGQYPSALAVANGTLFVGNGKGTGFENSSVVVNNSGRAPNMPNDRFPVGRGRGGGQGGEYSVAIIAGNISQIGEPNTQTLARNTEQAMRSNGLIGARRTKLFSNASPIKHVIYVIKENRTYDQVFGDVERSGDNHTADGDATLAIFGASDAAVSPKGVVQNITPNTRALALRFGLLDRFSSTRKPAQTGIIGQLLPSPQTTLTKLFAGTTAGAGALMITKASIACRTLIRRRMRRRFSALQSPQTISRATCVASFHTFTARRTSPNPPRFIYGTPPRAPDLPIATTANSSAQSLPQTSLRSTKSREILSRYFADCLRRTDEKSLEDHHSTTFRNFDLNTPDAMTVNSYRAAKGNAKETGTRFTVDPLINDANVDEQLRGASRLGAWLEEFRGIVADKDAGALIAFRIFRCFVSRTTTRLGLPPECRRRNSSSPKTIMP